MFWRKKESSTETYKKLLEILQLLEVKVVTIEKEVELLQLKFKKIAGISKKKEEEIEEEDSKKNDGFDKIRGLTKNIGL